MRLIFSGRQMIVTDSLAGLEEDEGKGSGTMRARRAYLFHR
jgi:hypothetical protein